MLVPTLVQQQVVDEKGFLTPQWRQFFEQLLQNMQQSLSDEGFLIPPQSAANIALLTDSPNGTIIYDETNNEFKGKKAGSFMTFTLT